MNMANEMMMTMILIESVVVRRKARKFRKRGKQEEESRIFISKAMYDNFHQGYNWKRYFRTNIFLPRINIRGASSVSTWYSKQNRCVIEQDDNVIVIFFNIFSDKNRSHNQRLIYTDARFLFSVTKCSRLSDFPLLFDTPRSLGNMPAPVNHRTVQSLTAQCIKY